MIVVADTSPLNYLVLIDEVDLLPALFGEVLIPQAVFQELKHPKTPAKVQQWIIGSRDAAENAKKQANYTPKNFGFHHCPRY